MTELDGDLEATFKDWLISCSRTIKGPDFVAIEADELELQVDLGLALDLEVGKLGLVQSVGLDFVR